MPPQTLSEALRTQHEAAIIQQAETIRDWPLRRERDEHAEIHVHLALWERGLGRISEQTLYKCYSTLNFVMPAEAAYEDEPVPLMELEREAEWVAAYHEQLERQSCPECGDGLCRPDDNRYPTSELCRWDLNAAESAGVTGTMERILTT